MFDKKIKVLAAIVFVGVMGLVFVSDYYEMQDTETVPSEFERTDIVTLASGSVYFRSGGNYWINPYDLRNYNSEKLRLEPTIGARYGLD